MNAESAGLAQRSVYVRLGETASTAAQLEPVDEAQRTAP